MGISNGVRGEVAQAITKELITVGRRLFDFGMVSGTGGNISALVPGTETVLMTKNGVCLGDTRVEDVVLVDLEDNMLQGQGKPSKECKIHLAVYKARADVGAIIHAHSPYLIAFSITSKELPILTVPAKEYLGRVPTVPAYPPGSPELACAVAGTLSDPLLKAVLMEAHGVMVVGQEIMEAFHLLGVLEDAARVAYLVTHLGH